ncbi:MAG TPA: hypothetical protein VHC93_05435 [Methylomirabilota bacterium]|nr:hypothetical protein [Methylomirabilota bacterium]
MTTTPHVDLALPDAERLLAASLAGPWRDLLYAPGPDFTSPLDAGAYRASFVIVRGDGAPIRVTSRVATAFGGELCRLRLEAPARYRAEALGSFFEPARTGTVYTLTPDREAGAARAPARAEWRYDGPSLAPRLGRVGRVRVLRERARGAGASWTADRGLVLTGADGTECLLLAVSEPEAALFLPTPGLHRALLEPDRALQPGVTVRDLLGHGERDGDLDVTAELHPL